MTASEWGRGRTTRLARERRVAVKGARGRFVPGSKMAGWEMEVSRPLPSGGRSRGLGGSFKDEWTDSLNFPVWSASNVEQMMVYEPGSRAVSSAALPRR